MGLLPHMLGLNRTSSDVIRGCFVYRDALFVVLDDGERYERASLSELTDLLLPKPGTATLRDQTSQWYEAQLIHYGLPTSKQGNTAEIRLIQAINQGSLAIPENITLMERSMKREYETRRGPTIKNILLDRLATRGVMRIEDVEELISMMGPAWNTSFMIEDVTSDIDPLLDGYLTPPTTRMGQVCSFESPASTPPSSFAVASTTRGTIGSNLSRTTTPARSRDTSPSQSAMISASGDGPDYTNLLPALEVHDVMQHVKISGTYSVISIDLPYDPVDLNLRLDNDHDQIWGHFNFGRMTGVLRLYDIMSFVNGQEMTFTWRSRDGDTGALNSHKDCVGILRTDRADNLEGIFYSLVDGKHISFEAYLTDGKAPEVLDLIAQWEQLGEDDGGLA